MRVGLPNALLHHYYGTSWASYLEALGAEPIISEPTTSDIVREGTYYADNETCLPMKVFIGHVMSLKGCVDYMLIPRLISQGSGTKACPKYLGLPDVARSLNACVNGNEYIPGILSPRVDLGDKRKRWLRDWYDMARSLGYSDSLASSAVGKLLAPSQRASGEEEITQVAPESPRVGILGHRYSINDTRVSLDLKYLMRKAGAEPVTVEQVAKKHIRRQTRSLSRRINWELENDFVGSALHWSRNGLVAGIIYAISFPCGPGSMISALLEDQLGLEASVPYMVLTLDEHSAETGLLTRVEAFVDMLNRRQVRRPSPQRRG